jgi:hypothetical protein
LNNKFKIKEIKQSKYIFDELRKKYVALLPEEWVRQNFIRYLIDKKNFPKGRIAVEYYLKVNKNDKRSDIVIFDKELNPQIVVECKAEQIKLTQETFEQAANYNLKLGAKYLIITNGISTMAFVKDHNKNSYSHLAEIPNYEDL